MAALSSGLSLGFSAIVLPQLDMEYGEEGDGLYRPFTIGMEGGSWIGNLQDVICFDELNLIECACINWLIGLSAGTASLILGSINKQNGRQNNIHFFSASIFGLGAVVGGFASSYLGARFGRRKSILILAVPDLIGWVLIAAAQNLPMMLVGRFLNGFCAAGFSPSIQVSRD